MTELNRPPRKPDYMHDVWYRWFLALHERVGGQTAPTIGELDFMTSIDLHIDQETEAGKRIAELERQLATGAPIPSPELAKQIDTVHRKVEMHHAWNARLAEIEKILESLRRADELAYSAIGRLAELEKRMSDIEIEVNTWQ